MSLLKKAFRVLSLVPIGLALLLIAFGIQNGWRPLTRLASYPYLNEVSAVDWYEPREPIAGPGPSAGLAEDAPGPSSPDAHPGAWGTALRETLDYWKARRTLAYLVWHRGRLLLEWYAPDAGPALRTNSMSMAKPLLALAIGAAVDRGLIRNEDEPVISFLPEWKGQGAEGVSWKHLLRMTSGLRFDENSLNPFSPLVRGHLAEDIRPFVLSLEVEKPPGERSLYRNFSSEAALIALERATGRGYASWLSETVWSKLPVEDASIWLDQEGGRAKGYCCVFARPRDWLAVGKLLLSRGEAGGKRVVSSAWVDKMLESAEPRTNYGFGVWLSRVKPTDFVAKRMKEPFAATDTFYLDGRGIQRVYVVPSRELIAVRIGEAFPGYVEEQVINRLVRAADELKP